MNVPGLPPLSPALSGLFAPGLALISPGAPLLLADAAALASLLGLASKPRWGVYKNDGSATVLVGDSVLTVTYERETRVPTYPVENGGFQSYNKVALPREMSVRLAKGGTKAEREGFLNLAATLVGTTDLYSVVQPDYVAKNMTFTRMRYDREAGPQLLVVELFAEEVRMLASTAFSNTANPNDAAPDNQGTVQTQTPTTAQVATLTLPK